MEGNLTTNSQATIRAQVYSQVILDTIHDGFLPVELARDVSEFQDGTTFNVPSLGDFIIRDLEEDKDHPIDTLDTGTLTLAINRFRGNGAALTDVLKEDSYIAQEFDAQYPMKQLEALKRNFETDMLAQVNTALTAGAANPINGVAHRFIASGTNDTIALEDIAYAKLAFDKAELPDMGRLLIVDPIAEMTLNILSNFTTTSDNPKFEGVVNTGFAKDRKFLFNIYGFDVWVSNRLPSATSGENIDTTTGASIAAPSGNGTLSSAGVVNQFVSLFDPTYSPYMMAWRRMPRVRAERKEGSEQDVFYTTARWGIGTQRKQSVVGLVTSATAYQ